MSKMLSFYKTSWLVNQGIFILGATVFLLVAGYFIPPISPGNFEEQIYNLNGFQTKHNDQPEVVDFYRSIKNNGGILVLGTSETTPLEGGNYFDYLNEDQDIDCKFSVLGGAGRTCGIHIPSLLHHRDEVKGLRILYYINPVYWREDLSQVQPAYWERYVNYAVCASVSLSEEEKMLYYSPVEEFIDETNGLKKVILTLSHHLRELRRKYFSDLRYHLFPNRYKTQFEFVKDSGKAYSDMEGYGEITCHEIDTTWNIQKSFTAIEWFKPIDTAEDYRFRELTSFIMLCERFGIDATFIVGPVNKKFIRQYQPEALADYELVSDEIKQILKIHQAKIIDATDISDDIGAFDDHQHHSSYGAYLIYQKIKKHLNEE
jgi:hypothetical protein